MHQTEARAFAVGFDHYEPLIVLGAHLVYDAVRAGLIGVVLEFVAAIGPFLVFSSSLLPSDDDPVTHGDTFDVCIQGLAARVDVPSGLELFNYPVAAR
jgi:hypothetical protein